MARAKNPDMMQAQLFKALSDVTRMRICKTLLGGEKNVTEICRLLRGRQPTVSRHLALLRMHDLIESDRKGRSVCYRIVPSVKRQLKLLLDRCEALSQVDR
jgi:ArsR family transcriptional regulator